MHVRRETAADVEPIRAVIAAAFARTGDVPAEVALVDELRAGNDTWTWDGTGWSMA